MYTYSLCIINSFFKKMVQSLFRNCEIFNFVQIEQSANFSDLKFAALLLKTSAQNNCF